MEQFDTLFGAPCFLFYSRYFHQFCHTSEQRKTRFIHLGDEGFLTQLLYENTVTVTRTACFCTSFPRVQEAQRKAATNKTHGMAGTPDFVTSISHTWYWDCILIGYIKLYIKTVASGHCKRPCRLCPAQPQATPSTWTILWMVTVE